MLYYVLLCKLYYVILYYLILCYLILPYIMLYHVLFFMCRWAQIVSNTEYDFVSRFFCPCYAVNEDPVTGSAHCTLAPYWSSKRSTNVVDEAAAGSGGGDSTSGDGGGAAGGDNGAGGITGVVGSAGYNWLHGFQASARGGKVSVRVITLEENEDRVILAGHGVTVMKTKILAGFV